MGASDARTFVLGDEADRGRVAGVIALLPEGWVVTVEPPRRTSDQNRLVHALMTEAVKGGFATDDGRRLSLSEAKTAFVSGWMDETGQGSDMVMVGQRPVQLRRSTTQFTPAELSSLVEYIRAECFHRGIRLSETP